MQMIAFRRVIKPKMPKEEVPPQVELDNTVYNWYDVVHMNQQTQQSDQNDTTTQEEQKSQLSLISKPQPQSASTTNLAKRGTYTVKMARLEQRQMQYLELKLTPKLPNMQDLRTKFPPIVDQGTIGSSTACALTSLVSYCMPNMVGSRLFLYYNERSKGGIVKLNEGGAIRDGVLSLMNYGICPESSWPYNITEFAVVPPVRCYREAVKHQVFAYFNIPQDLYVIKNALNQGYPFAVSLLLYESFEFESTVASGMVPVPNTNKEKIIGGYTSVCVGYDDSKQCFLMRGSWGTQVFGGLRGYFWVSYVYLLDSHLSSDLYCVLSFEK